MKKPGINFFRLALAFSVFAGFTIFGMEPFDKLQMLLMGIFVFIPTAINLLFPSPDPHLVDNEYVLKNERVFSLRSLLLAPMSVGAIQALVVMISRQIALNATENVWSAASSAIVTFVFSAFFASLSLKFDKPLFKVVKKDVKSSLVTFLICVCTALLLTLSPLKEFWQGSERWAFAGFLPLVISIALSFAPACALEVLKLIKKDDSAKRRDS